MSEEVKIVVTSQADLTAIRASDAELAALKRKAQEFDKMGAPQTGKKAWDEYNDALKKNYALQKDIISGSKLEQTSLQGAGRMAEAEALGVEITEMEAALEIQQRLNVSQEQAVTMARSQVAAEREIAEEKAAQLALTKAQNAQGGVGAGMGGGGAGFTPRGGKLGSTLRLAGVPMETAGLIGFGVLIAQMVKNAADQMEGEMDSAMSSAKHEMRSTDREASERSEKEAGMFGPAERTSQIREDAHQQDDLQDKIDKRNDEIAKLQRTWTGMLGLDDPLIALDKAQNMLDGAKKLAAKRDAERQTDQREKEIGLELDTARARGEHTVSGMKRKRVDEEAAKWLKDYTDHMNQFGSGHEKEAREIADLDTAESLRSQQMKQASGLVNARSGAGDIAQAASLASKANDGVFQAIHQKISEVADHTGASRDRVTRKDFGG